MTRVTAAHAGAGARVDTSVLGLRGPTEDWQSLPGWARYHLEAGLAIGRLPIGHQRCTLAVVVPTADYAATLCAVGIVLAAYERESSTDAPELFREFSQLPEGTPLTLRVGRRLLTGRLTGVRDRLPSTGEPGLGIQMENRGSGGLTQWIPRHEISRVGRADRVEVRLPNRQARQAATGRESLRTGRAVPLGRAAIHRAGEPRVSRSGVEAAVVG